MDIKIESRHSPRNHANHDVIIAGAGPVGLFLACELALAKCSVLILEKADDPHSPLKQIPFGIRGLFASTIEALYRRGLLDELEIHKRLKNPHLNSGKGARRQAGHFAGIPFHDGNLDTTQWINRLTSSTEANLISEVQELETMLARRAKALGVEIKRGMAVTDVQQTEQKVTVRAGEQSFECAWLVGCDGARSVARKSVGIEFAGTEPESTGYSTQIDVADPEKLKLGRTRTATGMYLQSQPGYVIIQEFDGGAFHNADTPITREHVQEVLRRVSHTDVTITALHVATTWTDRARQATTYRNGRVLLAGDAAHIHAPLGGQGLNLGLGDAMNLGWKLAATIKRGAPQDLLNSYQSERYPIGEQVLNWSRAQVAIMKPDAASRALHAIISDLINTRDGATYFAGRVWGVNAHYDLGGDHPLVGYSVPNFEFEDGTTIGDVMHQGQGLLVDFSSNATMKNSVSAYGDRIQYVSRRAKEELGLCAVLVRPDGIVAWASDTDGQGSDFERAVARWFGT